MTFTRLLCLALLVLFTSPVTARPDGEPAAVIRKLYDDSIKGTDAAFGLRRSDRRALSKSLIQLWAKADAVAKKRGDEIGPVDFDVVSMSQDPNIKSYTVVVERQNDKAATIAATFVIGDNHVNSGENVTVRYDLVHENTRWLIDDIRGSIAGKPYSLRRSLQMSLKN